MVSTVENFHWFRVPYGTWFYQRADLNLTYFITIQVCFLLPQYTPEVENVGFSTFEQSSII
jgi:hypothetical protein